jgi:demethylmenaquinone methyltransferase/2-methoxy-6-polyprenyl-1,4-benzoquinol methylase
MTVVPYKEGKENKKQQIAAMFNNISPKYDLLNHLLSFGIDISWRRKGVKLLKTLKPAAILDVATGTADFAIETLTLNPEKVVGIDISDGMLDLGRQKIAKRNLQDRIELIKADSEELPFPDNKFDAVIVAFGVRNFENLEKGLSEMCRVMQPGGRVVIIEFSKPKKFPFRQAYNFYFKRILPGIGRLISKDRSAYNYLPESVMAFPDGDDFVTILEKAGFKELQCIPLTFGISCIYTGSK